MHNNSMKIASMKRAQVLSVGVALALVSAAAFAQARQAAPDRTTQRVQLDVNKDGKLSADERSQMRGGHHRGAMGGGHGRMMALDTDKDGRISRTEAMAGKARVADHFDKMDINKDGYLDRADMQARMTQQRAEFFKGADANRDGRITRDEFIVEQGARSAERREKWARHAQAAGKQPNARTAPTDQQKIAFAGKAFDAMDSNKDGALTRAEFDAFKPKVRGMRPGMGGHRMDDARMPASGQ